MRRTPYAFFYLEDAYETDLPALLRARIPAPVSGARIFALAILTGQRHELDRPQLELLMSLPAGRWVDSDQHDPDALRELADMGLLVSDAPQTRLRTLRERDEALTANEWNPYAALYHYLTQWSGIDIRETGDEFEFAEPARAAARSFVSKHGLPPGEFADLQASAIVPLPGHKRDGVLYRTLIDRRTTRAFDPQVPISLDQFDTVLRYVFGCHGYATTTAGVVCIKRTSPSGGGLHPIEAYPIVSNVSGVDPGIYHYSVRDHSLVQLSELEPDQSRQLATSFMCGQSYFGAAHASFVLSARFYRNHWKYRRHQKAYTSLLMDTAHLSQTLYLVSGEVGLGAFITITINGRDIEERLGLDGVSEGVIAMAGCGQRAAGESPLELQVSPSRL